MNIRNYATISGLSLALLMGVGSSVAYAAPSSEQATLQESLNTQNPEQQGSTTDQDDASSADLGNCMRNSNKSGGSALKDVFDQATDGEGEQPTITQAMGPMLDEGDLAPYIKLGLNLAYGAIGSPYVYGATGPNAFDCSGLVCYCFGFSRGRTTYEMIDSLVRDGRWKTSMDELEVGDLVFPSSGHVGIYTGNGMMIHAPSPGRYVYEAPVYAFIGGGTF